jgi:hypothetical protein
LWRPHNPYLLGGVIAFSQCVVCIVLIVEAKKQLSRKAIHD